MDYEDQLRYQINRSRKLKNATRLFYYQEAMQQPGLVALASFETFRGSWAYDSWFAARRNQILAFVDEESRRFQTNYTY